MSDIGYSRNFRLAPNLTNDRASDVPIARATKACQPTDRGRLSAQIRCNGWLRMIPWTAKAHHAPLLGSLIEVVVSYLEVVPPPGCSSLYS